MFCRHSKVISTLAILSFLGTLPLGNHLNAYPPQDAQQTRLITVAVIDLEGTGVSQLEAATLTNRLRTSLVQTGTVTVLERGVMEDVLHEAGFQQTGCVSTECAIEVGKILGVQQIVSGGIGKIGRTFTVDARIIDVETSEILKVSPRDYTGDIDGLLDVVREIAIDLVAAGSDDIEAAEKEPVSLAAEEMDTRGELRVVSGRSGQIFDMTVGDEDHKGIRNQTVKLPQGNYRVVIKEHGYYDLVEEVSLGSREKVTVKANNEPILVPVKFHLYPGSSKTWVDGNRVSLTPGQELALPFGTHKVKAAAPKFKKRLTRFTIDNEEPLNVSVQLEPKSKSATRFLSTLLPGFGQFYADNNLRGLLFLGIAAGTVALLVPDYNEYQDESNLLEEYRNDYRNAVTLANIEEARYRYNSKVSTVNRIREQLITYSIAFGATWFINVVDAYFFHGIQGGANPAVWLSSSLSSPTNTSPIPVAVTFSVPVVDFTATDVTVGNGTVSNFKGSGMTYSFDVTPSRDGIVTVDVPANVAKNEAGNGNTAATRLIITYEQ